MFSIRYWQISVILGAGIAGSTVVVFFSKILYSE